MGGDLLYDKKQQYSWLPNSNPNGDKISFELQRDLIK